MPGDPDQALLIGLADLVNKDNVRPDINLSELTDLLTEKKTIVGNESVVERCKKELTEASAKIGIDLLAEPGTIELDDEEPEEQDEGAGWSSGGYSIATTEFKDYTDEQIRRTQVNTVVGKPSVGDFSLDSERREERKHDMLAELDSILTSLAADGVDISRVPAIDHNSDYDDIEKVLKVCRSKIDRTRNRTMFEEFMMFGAHVIEDVFDGNRSFGPYKPDMTGWHNVLQAKMARTQHENAEIASNIMKDLNVGPWTRLMLEIVPSMLMHSRKRQAQNNKTGTYAEDDLAAAHRRLSDL